MTNNQLENMQYFILTTLKEQEVTIPNEYTTLLSYASAIFDTIEPMVKVMITRDMLEIRLPLYIDCTSILIYKSGTIELHVHNDYEAFSK